MLVALGDLLLDVVVRLDGPIAADTDTYGRTRVGPGGQAANVAAWTVALGGAARFAGKRARDSAGRMLTAELERRGVEVVGPEVETGTGTVVSLADSQGRRTMLTDRGVAPGLAPGELDPAWLDGCTVLHLPVYSLARPPIVDAALAAATVVRGQGARVSVDLSGTSVLEALGVDRVRELIEALAPETLFGNEDELAVAGGLDVPTVVVKRGASGCLVRRGDDVEELPAEPTEVVDTTGAGDALAAGFLLGGPALGLRAAARCVAVMGAFPP